MALIQEFKDFIAKGNVMDLAVGVIIGAAFGKIVTSLTDDVIMPIVGAIFGNVDFSEVFLVLKPAPDGTSTFATLAAAKEAGAVTLNYGSFITAIINFLILAFIIFMMVKWFNNLKKKEEAAPAPAGPSETDLLVEIRDLLKK